MKVSVNANLGLREYTVILVLMAIMVPIVFPAIVIQMEAQINYVAKKMGNVLVCLDMVTQNATNVNLDTTSMNLSVKNAFATLMVVLVKDVTTTVSAHAKLAMKARNAIC